MTLIRRAKGLQRFMLDCGWWRSKKWAGIGLDAIGLQSCAISYCYEHGTDGLVPIEDLALALGLREKEVKAAVAVLLKKGRWIVKGDDYEIVGFADHNPSQAEIKEYREKKIAAGIAGNHQRHHIEKKVRAADCPLCFPPGSPNGSQVRPPPAPSSDENPSHPGSLSSAVVSRAEQSRDPNQSSSSHHGDPPASADDDDGPGVGFEQAVAECVDRRMARAHPNDPQAYRPTVVRSVVDELGPHIRRMLAEGSTVAKVCDALEPVAAPPPSVEITPYPKAGDQPAPAWELDDEGNAVPLGVSA